MRAWPKARLSYRQKSPIAALLTKARSIGVLHTGTFPLRGVSPYLIPPQSQAFINALLLQHYSYRKRYISNLSSKRSLHQEYPQGEVPLGELLCSV